MKDVSISIIGRLNKKFLNILREDLISYGSYFYYKTKNCKLITTAYDLDYHFYSEEIGAIDELFNYYNGIIKT